MLKKTNSRISLFNTQKDTKKSWVNYENETNFWKALSDTTFIFCKESTLHGFKKVADEVEQLQSKTAAKFVIINKLNFFDM